MTDLRNTFEDLAERFEPPSDGFPRFLRRYQERRQRRHRLTIFTLSLLVMAAALVAAVEAGRGNASAGRPIALQPPPASRTAAPDCSVPTGSGVFDTHLSSSSGPAGSTVTVSGMLPVVSEDGRDVGQNSTAVLVYWNLDFDHWPSIASPSPATAVSGTPVQQLGTQNVANSCTYQVQVTIPSVPAGTYPIEVLYEGPDTSGGWSGASFGPVNYQVTPG